VFKGEAKIIYDPSRGEMKRRTQWWCVANTDPEICRYYRWWIKRRFHINLFLPAWGAHISVVRGEKPRDDLAQLWKKYHNERIPFTYDNFIKWAPDNKNGGHYFWLVVKAPKLEMIRKELELPVGWNLHITIGRTYEQK
jgi:hypothetical protein